MILFEVHFQLKRLPTEMRFIYTCLSCAANPIQNVSAANLLFWH